jgi:hypothetical protein
MRFSPATLPPATAFWSITLADRRAAGGMVANPINRYSIGDRTSGIVRAADGSFTISMQHDMPASVQERANWLPAPEGPFGLALRVYVPRQGWEGYVPPAAEPIE